MSDKLDKFTKRARRVLTYAQEEATRLNHNYIGTEHLLLGLIREEEGLAAKVLRDLGVEQARVRQVVEDIVGRGQAAPVTSTGRRASSAASRRPFTACQASRSPMSCR